MVVIIVAKPVVRVGLEEGLPEGSENDQKNVIERIAVLAQS